MNAPFVSPQLRFLEPLGRGGTADVAKAHAEHLNRLVAVKYPLAEPDDDIDFSRLAAREWELIGGWRFPGLVNLLEQPNQDPPYLLLDLCPGPTLDTVGKIESTGLALSVISATAISLEFLNAAGLVHGDFKPHNVFLPPDWEQLDPGTLFWARLSDFSLGRRVDEPDRARLGAGTVGYMAPETISDNVTSHRSDLFALGVLAYQLLTGFHPFMRHDTDPVKINSAVREADYVPLSEIRPDLDHTIIALVHSLLALDPGARPESAWAVCEELKAAGCRYPFIKALRPAHLWRKDRSYRSNRVAILATSNAAIDRLDRITSQSPEQLRLCLTANFNRGNMAYRNGGFRFRHEAIWPCCLRRHTLHQWFGQSLSERKLAIRRTVQWLGTPPEERGDNFNTAITQLLPGLLRTSTIKRLAAGEGIRDRSQQAYERAARYFLLAGDLDAAEQCADQAGRILQQQHLNSRALRVLDDVLKAAELRSRAFDTRHLLLTKAEVQKDNGDVEDALKSYKFLVSLYEDHPPDKILAEAFKDIGDLYKMKKEVAKGLQSLQKAFEIFKQLDDTLELSHTHNNMGNLHCTAGELDDAQKHYRKALRIQRQLDVPGDVASTLNNLAATYCWRGNYQRGGNLFRHSLEIQMELGNKVEIARALNNLGLNYSLTGRMADAIDSLERSLEINRSIGNKQEIHKNLDNLIACLMTAGRLRDSLKYLKEGTALSESLSDIAGLATMRFATGIVYKHLGRLAEALEAIDAAEAMMQELDDEHLLVRMGLQRAAIRLMVGDRQAALDEALTLREEAREVRDPSLELSALLLAGQVQVDDELAEQARSLADRFHLAREKRLVDINQLEACLEAGVTARIDGLVEAIPTRMLEDEEDIENARTACLLAEAALLNRDHEQATHYLEIAERSARATGQVFEMVRAATVGARLDFEAGAYEACFARVKEALQSAKKISDSLTNQSDRQSFQQLRMIQYLGARARDLKAKLSGTARK